MYSEKLNASSAYPKRSDEENIRIKHFEWIDILRGLAAIGVVLFHSRVDLWVGWKLIKAHPENYSVFDRIMAWFSAPLPFLGSAVMLFFILSGFVIYYPVSIKKSIKIKSYCIRRFMRIVPPYLAAVLFSVIIEIFCKYKFGLKGSSSVTICKTLLMIQNYPPNQGQLISNPSLWSLPVEVELYIFFPVIFLLSNYIGKKFTFLSVAAISFAALLTIINGADWMMGDFLNYWIIWCSGSLLAHFVQMGNIKKLPSVYLFIMIAAFAIAIVMVIKGKSVAIGHFVWAAGYFFLLWFVLTLPPPSTIFSKLPARILLWLGKISYSVYLVHFPFFYLIGNFWVSHYGHKPTNFIVCVITSFFAVLLGSVFYKLVEKPSHILARKLGK